MSRYRPAPHRYNVVRNGDTPCQLDGAHHPHRWVCAEEFCDYDCTASFLDCCVCGEEWPCSTKRAHVAARGCPVMT